MSIFKITWTDQSRRARLFTVDAESDGEACEIFDDVIGCNNECAEIISVSEQGETL